jgi:hypothetical protein
MVYFSMVIMSEVEPEEIIECTNHEWAHMNGVHLQIKDLQFVESETVMSIYKVLKKNPKDVLLVELEKILIMAQEKARNDNMNEEGYDFLMNIYVNIGKSLLAMNLCVQIAMLNGQEVSTLNMLSNRAQYARKSWHLKIASKYAMKMKYLIQIAKEYKCIGYMHTSVK